MILRTEAKVGLAVFAAFVVLIGIYWFLGSLRLAATSFEVYSLFANAAKLDKGADVRMAGVKVGVVSGITLTKRNQARVNMLIWNGNKIPVDSVARVTKGGFIGDNYIDIVAGSSTKYVKEGGRINSEQLIDFDEIVQDSAKLLKELKESAKSLNDIVGDKKMVADLKGTVSSLKTAADSASALIGSAQGLIGEMGPEIKRALASITDAAENANKISIELEKTISHDARPGLRMMIRDASAAIDNLNKAIEEARGLMAQTQSLVGGLAKSSPRLDETLNKICDAAGEVKEIMKNLKDASAGVKSLATDNEMKQSLKSTLCNASIASEQAKQLLTSLNNRFGGGKVCRVSETHKEATPQCGFTNDSLWNTALGRYRFDANYTVPTSGPAFYRIGAYNIGENTRFNLQAGRLLDDSNAIRYGVYASRVGLGYDLKVGREFLLSADMFRPNDPEMEIKGVLSLGRSLGIYGGVADVFDKHKRDPLVGLRYQSR